MGIQVPHPARLWRAHGGKAGKGRTKYAVSVTRPSVKNKHRWFPTPEAALLSYVLTAGG